MNRTLAIVNQKGGVGKTTISTNLAAALAKEGKRVLVVDMDPQSHCAVGMAVPEEQIDASVTDWLTCQRGGKSVDLAEIAWQILPNLELAPSQRSLADFEAAESNSEDGETLLDRALETVRNRYDFIVVDCPPHFGLLMKNALIAADEVIIPVETGYFSLHGLTRQLETVEAIAQAKDKQYDVHVIANQYDVRTKLAREILAELRRKFEGLVLNSVINFNTKLKEGASFGQPITEFAPGSMGARDFQTLAIEIIGANVEEASSDQINQYADRLAESADRLLATTTPLIPSRPGVRPGAVPHPGADAVPPKPVEKSTTGRYVATEQHAADARPVRHAAEVVADPKHDLVPPMRGSGVSDTAGIDRAAAIRAEAIRAEGNRAEDNIGERAMREAARVAEVPAGEQLSADPISTDALHQRIDEKLEAIYGVRQTPEGVVFCSQLPGAVEVQLAGDFNAWMPHKTPMQRRDNNGTFETILKLDPGRYRYRLVIDGRWAYDKDNPSVETNEYGEVNSVIEIIE